MKVVTVTFHYSINYGAVLQCYALQRKLIDAGYDAFVLNYVIDKLNREQHIFNITPSKNFFRRFLSFIKQLIKYMLNYNKNKIYIEREKKFKNFLNRYIKFSPKVKNLNGAEEYLKEIPAVIVGSDQVWNPRITYGIDNIYYLKNYKGKKISYAASIGEEKIDDNIGDTYFNAINSFDFVSVRENSGRDFLKKNISKDIEVNIDPVFLISAEQYLSIAKKTIEQKYILIYSVEKNIDFVKFVNEIVKQYGLLAISLNFNENYENVQFYNAGVEEFLGLINGAELILTNSFHGTAFSLIFEKNFIVFPHSSRPERINNLLKMVSLENKIVNDKNYIKNVNAPINYKNVKKILNKEVQKSEKYISKALGE